MSVGIIHWVKSVVSEVNFFSLSTDYCPVQLALLDEVVVCHPLLHQQVLQVQLHAITLYLNPLGQPTITTGSDHFISVRCICLSAPTFQIQSRSLFASQDCGLAEWIIDDSFLCQYKLQFSSSFSYFLVVQKPV